MALKPVNLMGRHVAQFMPQDARQVWMYVCGPTLYSYAHIGNARPAVVVYVRARHLCPFPACHLCAQHH
jgi:cysteinyl-tRNA synthetase